MIDIGVVCGRFQIFHKEHLQYVQAAKKKCNYLIVGITSPSGAAGRIEGSDVHRGEKASNPCTFFERMSIIRDVLLETGINREEFDIVPYPIETPEFIHYYIPDDAYHFITILDQWGTCKKQRIESLGYPVEVLWNRREKGISSTMIRQAIYRHEEWKKYVPEITYQYIISHNIDTRIKGLIENDHTIS